MCPRVCAQRRTRESCEVEEKDCVRLEDADGMQKRERGKAIRLEKGDKEWKQQDQAELIGYCCACRKNENRMVAGNLVVDVFYHEQYIGVS